MSDTFKIKVNSDGSFDKASYDEAVYELIGGAFGRALYYVAEDFLTRAVNYTPILTGLLRSTGNVRLNNMPAINFHLLVRDPKTRTSSRTNPRGLRWKSGSYGVSGSVATLGGEVHGAPAYAQHEDSQSIGTKAAALSRGTKKFKFNIGFATPYALWIHEYRPKIAGPFGGVKLGKRSLQATRAHKKIYASWPNRKRKVWVAAKLKPYYGKVGSKYLTRAWTDNEARYLAYLNKWAGGKAGRGKRGFRNG